MEIVTLTVFSLLSLALGATLILIAIGLGSAFVQFVGWAAYALTTMTRKPRRPASPE